jgi:4-amino-4-deoxy-L-arabinose transferase-like glycosyltransferase
MTYPVDLKRLHQQLNLAILRFRRSWETTFIKNNQDRSANSFRLLLEISVTGVLLLAMAVPRLLDLDHFVTVDETRWLTRAGQFYYALSHHNLTFTATHPGVTVMWAGLASYLLEYPEYSQIEKGEGHGVTLFAVKQRQFDLPLRLLVTGRRILILFNLLVLVSSFLFARQIFGRLPALVGFLLIAFDPFHIALTKILHLDGTLANLMLLSLLAFLTYLERSQKLAFIISAVAAGFAWLTKSPGIFLVPFMLLLTVLYRLRLKSESDKTSWWEAMLSDAKMLAGWGAIAAFIFCLFWPAMWVHPIGSLTRVFTAAIGYAEDGHESSVFFNGHIYPSGKIPDISFYLINFLWRTTPVTLLGLLVAPLLLIQKNTVSSPAREVGSQADNSSPNKSMSEKNTIPSAVSQKWALGMVLLFALGFGAFMTIGSKKFDRYVIPSFTSLELVAGVSLVWVVGWIAQNLREKSRRAVTGILLFSVVAVQAALAWNAFPYFFNYYNPLLGGSRQAVNVMQIGWGEGLDQAARYLNEMPNSDRIRVMAWYVDGPFLYFSKSRLYGLHSEWTTLEQDQLNKLDYAVIYVHQWQRNIPAELLDWLKDVQPEYSVWIDGLEYVRVYKIR